MSRSPEFENITTPREKQPHFYGLVIGRCSSKPQLDRYGPTVQLERAEEGARYFPKGELIIIPEISIFVQEPASGWVRRRWEAAMDQVLDHFHQGRIQVVIFPCVDRESRFLAGSVGKLMEMVRSGLMVYFAEERLLLDPKDTSSLQTYWIEALKAQGFIDTLKSNTVPARRAAARRGEIPGGFGRYGGPLGLHYDKKEKRFLQIPGLIESAREILIRYLDGASSRSITLDLQRRGLPSTSGGSFHKSAVNRVLDHAKFYAGIITWKGIEIEGKVDPIITEAQAEQIRERMSWNKEKSYGFGKRKWLTGRVSCGTCGRRYRLDAKKGCYCNANDRCSPTHCDGPRVGWRQLQDKVLGIVGHTLFNPLTIICGVVDREKRGDLQQEELAGKRQSLEARISEFGKRRRLLGFQHEVSGLTDEEYLSRLQSLRREEKSVTDILNRMGELEMPTVGVEVLGLNSADGARAFFQFFSVLQGIIGPAMAKISGEAKDNLAETLDLKVVVYPGDPFSIDVMMKLPIEGESCRLISDINKVKVSPSTVFASS